MTPVSQIVWKNRHHLDGEKPVLLVCPPADDLATGLCAEGFQPTAICHSHATHVQLSTAGVSSHFSIAYPGPDTFPQIILFQPREKPLLEMMLSLCGAWLSDGGTLWLAGGNRAGIRSAGKRLTNHFRKHRKMDSARHCGLYMAQNPQPANETDSDSYIEEWSFSAAEQQWKIASLPGVFAHGHLDSGSQLLVETLTSPDWRKEIRGRILDFACGAGVVGIPLAGLCPNIELTLLDDSAIALEAARRSLDLNQTSAKLVASDGMTEILNSEFERFDWVVSNPPFHSGVHQDLGTAERFVRDCPRVLAPRGKLCLVTNIHLPYGRWLQELFGWVQVIASDRAYNIWLAQNPVGQRRP